MAKKMMDILLDADGDLLVRDGDWAVGESTYQHQRQLLLNAKGDYKSNPTICVDTTNFIDSEDKGSVKRAIAQQFLADGMEVQDLTPDLESITDSTARVFNDSFYV